MLLIIKSRKPDEPEPLSLPEKLRYIFTAKLKEARTDDEREAAQKALAMIGSRSQPRAP